MTSGTRAAIGNLRIWRLKMPFDYTFVGPDGYAVDIVEDSKVAYAYLLDPNEKIIGDVWLYNVSATPDEPEWEDREKAPFLNPSGYAAAHSAPAVTDADDFALDWHFPESGITVDIHLGGEPLARLADGSLPGWSRYALLQGPAAKPLPWSSGTADSS
jgi:hypothetical protein